MDTMDGYKVDLKGMTEDVVSHRWVLSGDFFSAVQGHDIKDGQVDVDLTVQRTAEGFMLDFRFDGEVQVECMRCSELMPWQIHAHHALPAVLGQENEDDGEVLTVAETPGVADLSWQMYSLLALEIPLRHTHNDGECNPAIEALLCSAEEDAPKTMDPRWEALQQLKQNK